MSELPSAGIGKARQRTLRAFCEVMTPPGGSLPAAEANVAVAKPVAEFLKHLEPRTLAKLRIALTVFEFSPFLRGRPRRFSRMSANARSRHIEALDQSRVSRFHDLLMLLKTLAMTGYTRSVKVHSILGYKAGCSVREGVKLPETRTPLDPKTMVPPAGDDQCDVVVIGSGAGGAVTAHTLAETGLDVVVLEEGAYYDRNNYVRDPLHALPALYRSCGLTLCEGKPFIPLPVGRCVGGTTVVNSGTCFRVPVDVLDNWSGAWGISWARPEILDPVFERLERELLIEPVDTETMGRNGQLCMEGASAIGASGGPIKRYADGCVECGTCPTGCELDIKQATHVSYLPRAVAAGARIYARCRAEKVLTDGGRVSGVSVSVLDEHGSATGSFKLAGNRVVVAAGALGTPELMARSQVRTRSGLIGRGLHIHPACWVGAVYEEEVRGWEGIMQSYYIDEWHDRGLILEATFTPLNFGGHWLRGTGIDHKRRLESYGHLGSFGVHLSDRSTGRVSTDRLGRLRVNYHLTRDDAEILLYGIARAADLHFAAGAREVYPQVHGVPPLRPGDQYKLERMRPRPAELHLEAFHPMGTCRMGSNPLTSVVTPTGEVHGVDGLFVTDASIFPTSLGVNPMLTIMACADQIARGIAEELS